MAIVAALGLAGCDRVPATCHEAIQDTLKAPSTYKLISSKRAGNMYQIEYDAENSFGVPLRGQGYCMVEGDNATWAEIDAEIMNAGE